MSDKILLTLPTAVGPTALEIDSDVIFKQISFEQTLNYYREYYGHQNFLTALHNYFGKLLNEVSEVVTQIEEITYDTKP